ncbi:MAG: AtpZ/AtpI family protein [Thermoguttaceae bacterium]|nr:AtpZ/AtpI family protein [Planctomycetaceae bacterium]MBQ4143432.1 AtpZ/AtpI family protein [Thermoguttaceae bacterium]
MKNETEDRSEDAPEVSPFKRDLTEGEEDLRAAWAVGFSRAGEISGIGMQFILPTLAGWWLDQKLGTGLVCLAVGGVCGGLLSFFSLLHLIRRDAEKR